MKKRFSFLIELIVIGILIAIDRFSKNWATLTLKDSDGIDLIPGVLKLFYLPSGNRGAAFGMFKGQLWLFILVTVIVCAILIYVLLRLPSERKYMILHPIMICIVAGGIGNLIDRVINGYVVDFIYFYMIEFPIFNVADCYVTVSTIILAFLLLFYYKEEDFKDLESHLVPRFMKKESEGSGKKES